MDDLIKEFGSYKEVRLASFSEFEIPHGLFPDHETGYIQSLSTRAMNMLGGKSLEDINDYFQVLYSFFNTMKQGFENPPPEMKAQVDKFNQSVEKSAAVSNVEIKIPSSPPADKSNRAMNTLSLADPCLFAQDDVWVKEKNLHDQMAEKIEMNVLYFANLSLYKFILVINEIKAIQSNPAEINDPYYRLGKAASGFDFIKTLIEIASSMSSELELIRKKEEASKVIRKQTSSKGGAKRVAKFDGLKKIVIDLYFEKYSNRSNRDAAAKISKELSFEIEKVLSTENPEITIAKWIGSYKKGREKSS